MHSNGNSGRGRGGQQLAARFKGNSHAMGGNQLSNNNKGIGGDHLSHGRGQFGNQSHDNYKRKVPRDLTMSINKTERDSIDPNGMESIIEKILMPKRRCSKD